VGRSSLHFTCLFQNCSHPLRDLVCGFRRLTVCNCIFSQPRKNVSLLKVTEFCSDVHGILVHNSSEAQSDIQPQPSMNVSNLSVDSALGQYIYHYIPYDVIWKLLHENEAINNTSRHVESHR
jgi:hypothetical protein